MKRIFTALALLLAMTWSSAADNGLEGLKYQQYAPSDENFCNPERGIFHHLEVRARDSYTIDEYYMQQCRAEGVTLLFIAYVLEDFRDGGDISDAYLQRVRKNLETLRKGGMKAVVRFCYSYDTNDKPWDVPLVTAKRHIEQLKPILQDCKDVIALVEAGFVGVWGEWYYTDNFVFQPKYNQYDLRRELIDALAEAVPSDRFIALRYPAAKLGLLQISFLDTIAADQAHNGSLQSRLSFHNDCFLADKDDMGTFGNNSNYRKYWAWESRFVPMGGETCTGPNTFSQIQNARENFATYHWSYLNEDYHPGMINEWVNNAFMDEIRLSLGYRLRLVDSYYTQEPCEGGNLRLVLNIENVGWAAPFNPRPLYLVLINKEKSYLRYQIPLNKVANESACYDNTDPRFWMPGTITNIDLTLTLPSNVKAGEYNMYLFMPDPESTLGGRPEYSIRLANDNNVWQPQNGLNRIGEIKVGTASINNVISDPIPLGYYDLQGRPVNPSYVGSGTMLINTLGQKLIK